MFFGSFWQGFGFQQNNSNLEELLKKNVPLEEILDEETIVADIRRNPKSFTTYLQNNNEELRQMIDYIIKVPDESESDEKKLYKYPFLVGEIFGTNNLSEIADFLFDEDQEVSNKSSESGPIQKELDQFEANEEDKQNQQVNEVILPVDENNDSFPPEQTQGTEEQKKEQGAPTENKETAEVATEKQKPQQETDKQALTSVTEENQGEENPKEQANNVAPETPSEEKKVEEQTIKPDIPVPVPKGQALLLHIFEFLQTDIPQRYPISAGYFQKLISFLIQKQGALSNFFLHKRPEIPNFFVQQIACKSIADLVTQILIIDGVDRSEPQFENGRRQLLTSLINQFKNSLISDELENITAILHEVIDGQKSGDGAPYQSLFAEICKKESLDAICGRISQNDLNASYYSISILNDIVMALGEGQTISSTNDNEGVMIDDNDGTLLQEELSQILKSTFGIISADTESRLLETSFQRQIVPLGKTKLKIVEFFSNILKSALTLSPVFQDFIRSNRFFDVLFDLVHQYEWNNILQSFTEKIVQSVLEKSKDDEINQLFFASNYIEKLTDVFINEGAILKVGAGGNIVYRGYIAFYVKLVQNIRQVSDFSESENKKWSEIILSEVFTTIETNQDKKLGENGSPKSNTSEIEEIQEDDDQKFYEEDEPVKESEIQQIDSSKLEEIQSPSTNNDYGKHNFWRIRAWDINDGDLIKNILKELEVPSQN